MFSGSPLVVSAYALENAVGSGAEECQSALVSGLSGLVSGQSPLPERVLGRVLADALLEPSTATRVARIAAPVLDSMAPSLLRTKRRWTAERIALVMGTSTGGVVESEAAIAQLETIRHTPAWYSFVEQHAFDALPRQIAERLELGGPVYVVSTACSSSAKALAAAARLIWSGIVDAALVGGCDSLCLTTVYGFSSLGVVDERPCRPFDENRSGMNLGEGAAFLILERDAPHQETLGYFLGAGETSDAHHLAHPDPNGSGAEQAMRLALAAAGLEPNAIDYVNAHGTATRANDSAEAAALGRVFGERPLVSSTKWSTGHLLGAAGATEAVVTLQALREGVVPGNGPGPVAQELPIRVSRESVHATLHYALSNSLAFGGSNASLVLAHPEASIARREHRGSPAGTLYVKRITTWPSPQNLFSPDTGPSAPEALLLSPRARGRSSVLICICADLLHQLELGGADLAATPTLYASAYGEMGTTLELLKMAGHGESSPLRFQSSVHNAAAGVLSILTKNQGFSTALAAGFDTVAMSLIEAFGVFGSSDVEELLLLIADESSCEPLSERRFRPLGVGIHLTRQAAGSLGSLGLPYRRRATREHSAEAALPTSIVQSPMAPGLRLALSIQQRRPSSIRLDMQDAPSDNPWQVDFVPT